MSCACFGSLCGGSPVTSINLSSGYLFRPLSHSDKEVLGAPSSSSVVYAKLKYHIRLLDLDHWETPHSLRFGCTIGVRYP